MFQNSVQVITQFNPIQTLGGGGGKGGGGRILPASILDVYNFFDKQAKATKLDFPKMYLEIIWCGKSLSIKFDVTMATTFWHSVFQNFEFPSFDQKSLHFLSKFYIFGSFPC